MLSKEDLQLLSDMLDNKLDEKLKPINERLDNIDEQLDEIKFNVEVLTTTTNALSEWAETVTEYHFPDIHYPLHDDEKIS